MSKNELKMEDYPAHWKATLMGEAFWKDAEEFNQSISDSIDARESHHLSYFTLGLISILESHPSLSRFPFSLGSDPGIPHEPSDQEKHHRRFSTSDALRSITSRASSPFPPRFDLRRGRSQSRSISPAPRRSNSLLRSTINMFTSLTASTDTQSKPVIPTQATPSNPLLNFRGGETWSFLDPGRRHLGLDVFHPVDEQEPTPPTQPTRTSSTPIQRASVDILPPKELEPLSQFRRLRVLKITGMLQSYQKQIWQAAWLNVDLEELELGMALKPRIRRPYVEQWPYIKGGWTLNGATYGEPVYQYVFSPTHRSSPINHPISQPN